MAQDDSSVSSWYLQLEAEAVLISLFSKLVEFPEDEKAKVVTSWISNSYADLINFGKGVVELEEHLLTYTKVLNMLVQNSSLTQAKGIVHRFQLDFLKAFVQPALLDVSERTHHSMEELATATHYFQIVCENVTQPLLIEEVIQFVTNELLPTLLIRLRHDDGDVLGATLGLLRAVLEFYCEDLWHDLILQYLLPMKHLMVSERQKAICEINYEESTSKFLDMIPPCMFPPFNEESLAEHFTIYTQQELQRLRIMDSKLAAGLSEQSKGNPLFPQWAFKYDGTDVLTATRKTVESPQPEEFFENSIFQEENGDSVDTAIDLDDHPLNDNSEFHLPQNSEPLRVMAQTNSSTAKFSVWHAGQYLGEKDNPKHQRTDEGSLGLFLDSILKLLEGWLKLEPFAAANLSDMFSMLASSRLPLISSFLLDFTVVLQPSFPRFQGALHSIRYELEHSVSRYPTSFIKQEWKKSLQEQGFPSADNDEEDLFEKPESIADKLKSRISKSASFNLVKKSSFGKMFGPQSRQQTSKRLENKPLFGNEEEKLRAQKRTLRAILFSHWMLELAAIAQQSCWYQSRQTQQHEEEVDYYTL